MIGFRKSLAGRGIGGLVILLTGVIHSACAGADQMVEPYLLEVHGDTTLVTVTSAAEPTEFVVEAFETLWRSEELESPRSMVRHAGRLYVADRNRLHVLDDDSGHVATVGRPGEGPGEFGSIMGIGVLDDTVVVFDVRNLRHSLHDVDGTFIETRRATPATDLMNPLFEGPATKALNGGLLSLNEANPGLSAPVQRGVVWRDLSSDSLLVMRVWDHIHWKLLGEIMAPSSLFGPVALIALGDSGTFAVGDGQDYCFSIETLRDTSVLRVCREWDRVPVGTGIRSPDFGDLGIGQEVDDNMRGLIRASLNEQEIEDVLPSYDWLLFADDGRLWVRTIGPEFPDVHPYILSRFPDLGPDHRIWEAFDPDGRLDVRVRLPTSLDPRVIDGDTIWGFGELESGEKVIARVDLPR